MSAVLQVHSEIRVEHFSELQVFEFISSSARLQAQVFELSENTRCCVHTTGGPCL